MVLPVRRRRRSGGSAAPCVRAVPAVVLALALLLGAGGASGAAAQSLLNRSAEVPPDRRVGLEAPAPAPAGAGDTTTIGFNEAIRIALDQNTQLRRASGRVDAANATIWAERMDFTPRVDVSTTARRSFGQTFSQEQGGLVNETTDFLTGNVSASLTLFDGFGNIASLKQAGAEGESSTLSLGRTRQEVVFQVMDRYITLIENREVLRVQREQLDALEQQLEQTREFVDAGSQPVSALYEQQANVAEQETSVLQAERDVQLARTRLIQTLQLDPAGTFDFATPSLADDSLRAEEYRLPALMDRATQRRLDLKAAQADVRAAEQGVRVAKSSYYPSVSIGASYGTDWTSRTPDQQVVFPSERQVNLLTQEGITVPERIPTGDPQITQLGFLDKLDNRRGGSFSVSLSIPVFQGLRRNAQVEQAQVQAQNARYDLQDQRQQVALEVRQAYLDYQNASQQLESSQRRLRYARQNRQAVQERYNLGAASIVELSQANRTFVQAASQRVRARYNFVFQKKLIDYYTGVINPQEAFFQ
jgi:outer membrane protein